MLKTINLQTLYDTVINHIKAYPIPVYHQYKPKTINPPLIVYRTEHKQTPKIQKYYKKTPGKNYHKLADLEVIFHLFLTAKQDQILTLSQALNSHISALKTAVIDNEKVHFTYEVFSPFDSPEFEKEEYQTMKAVLTAKTVILDERDTLQITVG